MTENQINEAFIVGHSLGGAIGINLAAAYPEKVRGLVLVDTPVIQKAHWLQKRLALNVFRRQFARTLQSIYAMMCEDGKIAQRVIETALKVDKSSFISLIQEIMGMNFSTQLQQVQV